MQHVPHRAEPAPLACRPRSRRAAGQQEEPRAAGAVRGAAGGGGGLHAGAQPGGHSHSGPAERPTGASGCMPPPAVRRSRSSLGGPPASAHVLVLLFHLSVRAHKARALLKLQCHSAHSAVGLACRPEQCLLLWASSSPVPRCCPCAHPWPHPPTQQEPPLCATDPDFDAIVVSEETVPGAHAINKVGSSPPPRASATCTFAYASALAWRDAPSWSLSTSPDQPRPQPFNARRCAPSWASPRWSSW